MSNDTSENIEREFEKAVEDLEPKIQNIKNEFLEALKAAKKKCKDLSEESGVPVDFTVFGEACQQNYFPKSFDKKWGERLKNLLDEDEFADFKYSIAEDRDDESPETGWSYWNVSTMNC